MECRRGCHQEANLPQELREVKDCVPGECTLMMAGESSNVKMVASTVEEARPCSPNSLTHSLSPEIHPQALQHLLRTISTDLSAARSHWIESALSSV